MVIVIKKSICICFVFILTFMLTACWDSVELENRGFVIAMGIDRFDPSKSDKEAEQKNNKEDKKEDKDKKNNEEDNAASKDSLTGLSKQSGEPSKDNGSKMESVGAKFEDGKQNKRYTVTMALPNLSAIVGNGGGEDEAKSIKKADSETVGGAIRIVDTVSGQKLYFGHSKACIFGKDILKDKTLFKEALDFLERNDGISRKIIILAAEETAEDMLGFEPLGEPLIGMFITKFFRNNSNAVAVTYRLTLEKLVSQLRETSCAIVPEIKILGNEAKISGASVIKDYELAGHLNDEQTRGYLWFKGDADGAEITAQLENRFIPIRIEKCRSNVSFKEEDDKIKCYLKVSAEGTLEEYSIGDSSLFSDEMLSDLEIMYERIIEKEIKETEGLFKNNYKADGFGYKGLIKKLNYDLYNKSIADWDSAFNKTEIVANINVTIRNTGAIK